MRKMNRERKCELLKKVQIAKRNVYCFSNENISSSKHDDDVTITSNTVQAANSIT